MNDGPTNCKACGLPLDQVNGGHRVREYCNDTCKQVAYRARKEEGRRQEMRARWADYPEQAREQLEQLMVTSGCDLVKIVTDVLDSLRELGPRPVPVCCREEAEREPARYRQLCDLDDREQLLAQAAALGAQIGYPSLLVINPPVRAGEASWSERLQQADTEDLARIIAVARHFAENLIWLEVHDELQRAQRRIADLERQVEHNQMPAVSSQPGA